MPADMWLANLPTMLTVVGGLVLLKVMARDARERRVSETAERVDRPDADAEESS